MHSGDELTGHELGTYRLLHVLGTGGTSQVYLAQRTDDPAALVAVKLLMPAWQPTPHLREVLRARFEREVQATQRLKHPHILPVLDYGEEGEYVYMVMPFVAGGTLAARIGAYPRGLPFSTIAHYLRQLADALDYAHSQGIVHRDIKPTNVLIDGNDQVVLSDFGIARLLSAGDGTTPGIAVPPATLTTTGQVLGTPQYMAPEQTSGASVTQAADIYALGVLLYQMVTGILPFEADTPLAVAMKHLNDMPLPPSTSRKELPRLAEAAMLQALAKRPDDRISSAQALCEAFETGLASQARDRADLPLHMQVTQQNTPAGTAQMAHMPTVQATITPTVQSGVTPTVLAAARSVLPRQTQPERQRRARYGRRSPAQWAIAVAIVLLAVVVGAQALAHNVAPGVATSHAARSSAPTPTVLTEQPTATATKAVTTMSAIAACTNLATFSHSTSATGGSDFPDVPFPPASVSAMGIFTVHGNYHFQFVNVCTASSTVDGVRAFYTSNFPVAGWTQSATYPYQGNSATGCGDPYCWASGVPTSRYASLEDVQQGPSVVLYVLRLAKVAAS